MYISNKSLSKLALIEASQVEQPSLYISPKVEEERYIFKISDKLFNSIKSTRKRVKKEDWYFDGYRIRKFFGENQYYKIYDSSSGKVNKKKEKILPPSQKTLNSAIFKTYETMKYPKINNQIGFIEKVEVQFLNKPNKKNIVFYSTEIESHLDKKRNVLNIQKEYGIKQNQIKKIGNKTMREIILKELYK